ncbi:methyl-accepting chemotaxis protein [Clostridium grantii]|uniref:HAMP domain-containing protein n=1 Tax=Clostridium grantii DSM 8605 TaxID=1121316 RepID=A0A1M5XAU3_9CLOT|nr:methyl-accepting chemotaxis protein [Clostridium grantii]SHH96859.1 HAMP domain-containing protein [Clostridium grantii DSM 8605]
MKWLRNLKLRFKLIICFGIMAFFIILIGTVAYLNLEESHNDAEVIYKEKLLPISYLTSIQKNLLIIQVVSKDMIIDRDLNKFDNERKHIETITSESYVLLENYEKNDLSENEQNLLSEFKEDIISYTEFTTEFLELLETEDYEAATELTNRLNPMAAEVNNDIDALVQENMVEAELLEKNISNNFDATIQRMLVLIATGGVVILILGILITRFIRISIEKLALSANEIEKGNLNIHIDIDSKDEFGNLAKTFTRMAENMNHVLRNINVSSEQVASGSKQVSDSSSSLSQGATEQASSIEELTVSIEEIATQTRKNAENANMAKEVAELAKKNANKGNKQMNAMLSAM